jgi:hypothetical protein
MLRKMSGDRASDYDLYSDLLITRASERTSLVISKDIQWSWDISIDAYARPIDYFQR